MGIFGKGSTVDPSMNPSSSSSSRHRRNSSSSIPSNSVPVSIVPAPPQGTAFMKPTASGSGVFGRQQTWSDQMADATLLKGTTQGASSRQSAASYPSVIPSTHNANILYGNGGTSNDVKFVHATMEILENQIKREEAPKKKRTRTSTEQLRILQKAFQTDPMPNSTARMALSKKLGMSSRAVQVWFQNRRAKEKLDAKRSSMGLSGSSSFAYVKGNSDDDLDEDLGQDDDSEFNFDEEDELANESVNGTDQSAGSIKSTGEYLNSMKANGMMGRMAFNSNGVEGPIKSQRSSSTPNGFFQGGNSNTSVSNFNSTMSSAIQPSGGRFYGGSKAFSSSSYAQHLSSNNPLCHLFPGETFISDVNEASVDQLYQDLGGAGSIPSPIDESGMLSSQNITGFPISSSSGGAAGSSSGFFTFGDPFYGGGIVDRTPSVSPVGFSPRSHFFHPIGSSSASSFDFMLPPSQHHSEFHPDNTISSVVNSSNACKGLSGGNVYLTSSFGGSITSPSNSVPPSLSASNRRSFSLPEAHVNLSFQQMQHLENFGLQVFPSPLLSINEEESINFIPNSIPTGSIKNIKPENESEISSKSSNAVNSNEFLIPFSDFLEGEVIR